MENNITTEHTQAPETIENTTVEHTQAAPETVSSEPSFDDLEEDALNFLNDTGEPEEQQGQEQSNNGQANENEQSNDSLNLNDIDLSFLGIEQENQINNGEQSSNGEANQQQQEQPNQIDELKQMIQNLNNGQASSNDDTQMPDEEKQAVTELFNKFKALGLVPQNNAVDEEQKQLLEDFKKINESFKQQQEEQKAFEEHQAKLTALQDFDKELSDTIPGYDSNLIQKAVADINKTNPDAAQKIFENPSLLIKLWREIGSKSQPSQKQQNIISTNNTQGNKIAELERKVNNGTATEWEEAQFLNAL